MHDQIVAGRRFRMLNVVNDVTRKCLAAVPDTSFSGCRVVRQLKDLIALCYMSQDFKHGLEAFLAKKKPEWTGA